jgi:hypothetical protein
MKKFVNAEIELISFDSKDIIVTSGFNGEDDDLTKE